MGVQAVQPPSSGSAPHSALVLPLRPDPWGLTRGPGGGLQPAPQLATAIMTHGRPWFLHLEGSASWLQPPGAALSGVPLGAPLWEHALVAGLHFVAMSLSGGVPGQGPAPVRASGWDGSVLAPGGRCVGRQPCDSGSWRSWAPAGSCPLACRAGSGSQAALEPAGVRGQPRARRPPRPFQRHPFFLSLRLAALTSGFRKSFPAAAPLEPAGPPQCCWESPGLGEGGCLSHLELAISVHASLGISIFLHDFSL